MKIVLPLYNARGHKVLVEHLAHLLPRDVTFLLVSGNMDKPLDVVWVDRTAGDLKARFPESTLLAATAGLDHVRSLTEHALPPVKGVVYIYEPNFGNEPEFTWTFADTLAHFAEVRRLAHARDLWAFGKPTGRPLYQAYLYKHGWDYAALGAAVDGLFVQTQTYCKKDPTVFGEALGALVGQYRAGSRLASREASQVAAQYPPFVQVSLDPASRNGARADEVSACVARAAEHATAGALAGLLLWWSPRYPEEVARCLAQLSALRGSAPS